MAQGLEDMGRRLGTQGEETRKVARVVLLGLHIQLPEEEARRVEAKLPEELRTLWGHAKEDLKEQRGSHTSFSRGQFIAYVADHTGLSPERAEQAIRGVFRELRGLEGIEPVVERNLSEGILELWAGTATQPAPGPPR